jgi:hypothetical protein
VRRGAARTRTNRQGKEEGQTQTDAGERLQMPRRSRTWFHSSCRRRKAGKAWARRGAEAQRGEAGPCQSRATQSLKALSRAALL